MAPAPMVLDKSLFVLLTMCNTSWQLCILQTSEMIFTDVDSALTMVVRAVEVGFKNLGFRFKN